MEHAAVVKPCSEDAISNQRIAQIPFPRGPLILAKRILLAYLRCHAHVEMLIRGPQSASSIPACNHHAQILARSCMQVMIRPVLANVMSFRYDSEPQNNQSKLSAHLAFAPDSPLARTHVRYLRRSARPPEPASIRKFVLPLALPFRRMINSNVLLENLMNSNTPLFQHVQASCSNLFQVFTATTLLQEFKQITQSGKGQQHTKR